jgi:hypothetical protein
MIHCKGETVMRKYLFYFLALFFLSCKNDLKYVFLSGIDNIEIATMRGYLIYRNHKDNSLYYFDIENNCNIKMPFETKYTINNHYKDFDFFFLDGNRVMASYDINDKNNISIKMYTFPDFVLVKTIVTDFHFDTSGYYKFKYIPETNELFITMLGADNIIIELSNNRRKLVAFNSELNYYNNRYIGEYTGTSNHQVFLDDSYPFLNSHSYRFSAIYGKVLYREKASDKTYYIKIYDLNTGQILNTGLTINEILLYSIDKYQYSFCGDDLILYGVYDKSILKQIKYRLESFLSGGMKNDPPLTYKIFDVKSKKDIGYFKNIDAFDILTYF